MGASSKVAVIGARGQLGSDLVRVLSERYEVVGFTHEELEVADMASVERALGGRDWAAIVNTAAFHRVEACEADPERAFRVNALGALNVARVARAAGAKCVYISTDYVFDGAKGGPYLESDPPRPINVYGASKLAGEQLCLMTLDDALVLRISSVFGRAGASGKGGNFVETILQKARAGGPLRVVADQFMSPSYTLDVARLLMGLLEKDVRGVVHGANQGVCSWHELAQEAVRLCGLGVGVEPIPSSAFPSPVKRPPYSALASERLAALGLKTRPWREALGDYLREKGHLAG
ncbi:MAG: dTDP-4-dehydrorhamnose reductase [Meiothermus sp.]|uniref:dTDP-4-dehydrorhamnose reductase n=1 Tax=Meiothermus sp. TaxID=1955249 RepID=UPI00298EDDC2|nr:dTDP-4-dehydrorhamnose reductase [Meiothermus sp.]MCS7194993.1 dTDP-4-dehydrorhamnose reductase [Meiothermus sp.]MDW8091372.1 dTDP-4-dehydrorhamnose reductase [Meiothermus sp.]MDW8482501.1 dTDP-4-dehydrorhamnose reductase [Meiothermus sp.]